MKLIEAKNLKKRFKKNGVLAVDNVSFEIESGKTLGLLGESGSGKSTVAKLVIGLLKPDAGQIYFRGKDISRIRGDELKEFRRNTQIIFQHPYLSLDPRMKIGATLKEPFKIHKKTIPGNPDAKIEAILTEVGLSHVFLERFPHQLSGGECQRVVIARALILEPDFLVCDEAVSSLDALTQVQIVNLLLKHQREKGMSFLFISHDWTAVRHMSDTTLSMKDGACKGHLFDL